MARRIFDSLVSETVQVQVDIGGGPQWFLGNLFSQAFSNPDLELPPPFGRNFTLFQEYHTKQIYLLTAEEADTARPYPTSPIQEP
jgi:hypothetical protein